MKIGIFTPLHARPDFARMAALQYAAQSRPPDVVVFYQNGTAENYSWILQDLDLPYRYEWIFNPEAEPSQSSWYAVPLKTLLDQQCDYYFWCDHDDIFLSSHISDRIVDLIQHQADIVLNTKGGILKVVPNRYEYSELQFLSHDVGGISSSMAFNRAFAEALYADLTANIQNPQQHWADNVVSKVTMPKFKVFRNTTKTSVIYVCHDGTVSSSNWLKDLKTS
jgi:hypothetical protein